MLVDFKVNKPLDLDKGIQKKKKKKKIFFIPIFFVFLAGI